MLAALESDAEVRLRIAGLLGVPAGLPEALNRLADEIRAQRLAFEARFAESDRRFEALQAEMDRRFEAVDRRFEAVDRRFEEILREMNDNNRRLADLSQRFADLSQRFDDLRAWVEANVGGLQRRAGRRLENTIAGTLRFAMDVRDIRPEQLRLRQKMRDERGLIGPAGREYEYDLLATNGEVIVFEIKSVAEVEDVERLSDKARLAAEVLGRPDLRTVLVTLDKIPEIVEACERLGVTLV